MARLIKKLQPKASNRAIAAAVGVNRSTVDRDIAGANAPGGAKKSAQLPAASGANAPPGPTGQAAGKIAGDAATARA